MRSAGDNVAHNNKSTNQNKHLRKYQPFSLSTVGSTSLLRAPQGKRRDDEFGVSSVSKQATMGYKVTFFIEITKDL